MEILSPAMMGVMPLANEPVPSERKLDELAAARFSELMQAPVAPAAPVSTQELAPASGEAPSWGDRILSGMQGVSNDFHSQWDSVRQTLASPRPLESREMLQMQLQMHHMSIQSELVGKLVSRSTQNIDQLVRLQ